MTKESADQGLSFLELHPFVRQSVLDKIYGSMIGSALGDTVGLYTEFLPKYACEKIYADKKPFSLVDPLPQDFAARLQIWIEQGLRALDRPPCGIGALVGSVVSNSAYLKDPADCATQRWIKTHRHVAPNGSLMRNHSIGLMSVGLSEEQAWKIATDISRTTHVDPRCVVSCCISVGLIRGMLRGEILTEKDVDLAIERAYDWVLFRPELMNPGLDEELTEWEIERHLERKEFERHVYANDFEELKLDSNREMGYVYKCLGSAILTLRYAMRATKNSVVISHTLFETLMMDLIMEGGDADTNGAVAGALLGAYLGYSNLPQHWSNGLAHKDWLMSKIERLTIALGIVDGNVADMKDEASDGGKGLMTRAEDKERRDKEDKARREAEKAKGLAGWMFSGKK
ncbi:ADP-ribosylglycohydrolase-domain-containing protein [Lophiotrema nucula]|uniref:ADP-ribosylglycohydrolase-domain-containing protein n=1 Tax=Lophiotrema nucula TaxID=690887 RepID=A0A6A5ZVM4_9PLEO|nr:ADP-ribosylglycohydrolase-domain-containing protein [Lophiotrema nucula]